MSAFDLVTCPECGVAMYPTSKGAMRKHQPRNVRQGLPDCPGSGKPGTPVERTVGR